MAETLGPADVTVTEPQDVAIASSDPDPGHYDHGHASRCYFDQGFDDCD